MLHDSAGYGHGYDQTDDRKAAGKAKEAVAEVLGDGKLQEEARAEQRRSEDEIAEEKESGSLNPLGNLNRLT